MDANRRGEVLDSGDEIRYMAGLTVRNQSGARFEVYMNEARVSAGTDVPPEKPVRRIQLCLTAGRVWALPASTMSVVFGTVLAVTIGGASFDLVLFAAAFVGMALLQVAANLLNDVYDYRNGLDRQVHPASGAVVREWITPGQGWRAAAACLAIGSLLGFYIVSRVGVPILWLGAIGVLCAVLYTWGPWPLKYHAFGDLAVFLNFGVLGALGAWTVQTGSLSWVPAVWAVPMSLLVIAILHSNNWRDISCDGDGEVRTVAGYLGDTGSQIYQVTLLFAPFVIIAGLVLLTHVTRLSPTMPTTFLVTLLALPLAVRLVRTGSRRHDAQKAQAFAGLDGATAQLNLLFSLLCVAALGLHALIG
jgi:1,4-dihydroxy-2-naphthoate octaprenyltransferase